MVMKNTFVRHIIDGNKWIYFERAEDKVKTQIWDVINKSSEEPLARIEWYFSWRQYVIYHEPNTVYNDGCLETITAFMKRLNKEHKILQSGGNHKECENREKAK